MNLDRDLREALAPLAGDPASDAARVMASLPPLVVPPEPVEPAIDEPALPPVSVPLAGRRGPTSRRAPQPAAPTGTPWGLLAAAAIGALALGVVGGVWWANSAGDAEPPPPREVEQPEEQRKEQPKEDKPPAPMSEEDLMMLMAFGDLDVDEPGVGTQQLERGAYRIKVGTRFSTGEAFAGLYAYANDARIRLDQQTDATVAADRIDLSQGRVWVSTVTRPAAFEVRTGDLRCESKAVELQVERRGEQVLVLCLEGNAQLRVGETRPVAITAMHRTRVADGVVAPPEPVAFVGEETAWMVTMIRQQQDERELLWRIEGLVKAFALGTHRDLAEIELRRYGARVVPYLFEAMIRRGVPVEEQRQAAALMVDVAEYSQTAWLFALLENDDADVRAAAFGALLRVGKVRVEDEQFWREAPLGDRERSIARWRTLLR